MTGLRTSILDSKVKKGGPELVKRGHKGTQALYFVFKIRKREVLSL